MDTMSSIRLKGNGRRRQFRHLKKIAYSTQTKKCALDSYLEEKEIDDDDYVDFNVLEWWNMNKIKYKILSKMARDILSIQMTTVAPESAFITEAPVVDENLSIGSLYLHRGLVKRNRSFGKT